MGVKYPGISWLPPPPLLKPSPRRERGHQIFFSIARCRIVISMKAVGLQEGTKKMLVGGGRGGASQLFSSFLPFLVCQERFVLWMLLGWRGLSLPLPPSSLSGPSFFCFIWWEEKKEEEEEAREV